MGNPGYINTAFQYLREHLENSNVALLAGWTAKGGKRGSSCKNSTGMNRHGGNLSHSEVKIIGAYDSLHDADALFAVQMRII